VLHPVGPLPAVVYWRRRVLVLTLLLSVLGGGGWVGYAVATGRFDAGTTTVAATTSTVATPALERVLPSLAGVQIPTIASSTAATSSAATSTPVGTACTDDMISVAVHTPGSTAQGIDTTLELVVGNAGAVPCVRSFDKQLQELVLLDAAGNRIWGSNDCLPETSSDPRTLAPGEVVSFPVEWSGLTSEPTCTAARVPPPPGAYLVRGRLDTKVSVDAALTIG
jgi:hypothetical protein